MFQSRTRLAALLTTTLTVWGLFAAPAATAGEPPANDMKSGAIPITGLPFEHSQNTADATVDDDDAIVQNGCGIGVYEHSVWFAITVTDDSRGAQFDVTDSDFNARIGLIADTDFGTFFFCGSSFTTPAGFPGTYYFAVFGDGTEGGATSGNFQLTVEELPPPLPPPDVTVTIDPTGSATKEGSAVISGTLSCTGGGPTASAGSVDGDVTQTIGRFIVSSYFWAYTDVPCDGTSHAWSGVAEPSNGKFAGGRAEVQVHAYGCNYWGCNWAEAEATVRLNRAPRR